MEFTDSLILLTLLVCAWIFSYKILVSTGLRSEIVFSVLSMTHWLLAFLYFNAIIFFQLDEQVEKKIFGGELTSIQLYFHILTCSYFGFDIVAKYFKKQLDAWLTIHHGLTLLFICVALIQQQSGAENIYILRYATFCNVPMNFKNIMRLLGQQNRVLYHISNLLYIGIYSTNFLVMLPYCLYQFYIQQTCNITFNLLVLLCIQAQYTIFKTLLPSAQRSIHLIKKECKYVF